MKPLMLVLEGPECTGKTTIVQRLADEQSCHTHKRVRTKERFAMLSTVVNDIDQQLMRVSVDSEDNLIVFDRWQLVSDIVYEKYCYNQPSILEELYPTLGKACDKANILVVHVTIDKSEMVRRFVSRGDRLRTIDEAILVHEAYTQMFSPNALGTYLPYITLDATGLNTDELYERILSIIQSNGGNVR
ncbi:MAG: hypothetical protein RR324_01300 [Cellulosilyticaceae bacterium]